MDWLRGLVVALSLLAVASCNETSTTSSGGSSSSNIVEESFVVDGEAVRAQYGLALELDPQCKQDPATTFPQFLPRGLLVYQRNNTPTRLVVFAHGFGHSVSGTWRFHMRRQLQQAQSLPNNPGNVAFVATDYRDNFGFPALRGAHDTIAATLYALEKFPEIDTVYLLGVSMGGAVSGTAIVEAASIINTGGTPLITKPNGSSLFDYWIDVEGVSQLAETYTESVLAAQAEEAQGISGGTAATARAGIERDIGGDNALCPLAFQRRSPALHAPEMRVAEIQAATVIHAIDDGLVPYNQGREMATALAASAIPTRMYTVLTTFFNPGTTLTGYVPGEIEGNDVPAPDLPLAGHASEADFFHPVMSKAFAVLREMLDGTYDKTVPYEEILVDALLGEQDCSVFLADCIETLQGASEQNPEQIAALLLFLLAQQQ